MTYELRIGALYPDLMNIYADRGNLAVLQRRCAWRGISAQVRALGRGDPIDPDAHDLFYIGGGQDRDQRLVAGDMREIKRDGLVEAARTEAVILAVCGGYQLLGRGYQIGEERLEGLGLVDIETVREPGPRLIGNVAIETVVDGAPRVIAGFENHGGRTHLGEGERPLGRVLAGHGNNGRDRTEGVRRANVFGTYLHGPLLPKNAWLADHLVELALERRYGERPSLTPLDDTLEDAAHAAARRVALRERRGRLRFRRRSR